MEGEQVNETSDSLPSIQLEQVTKTHFIYWEDRIVIDERVPDYFLNCNSKDIFILPHFQNSKMC